MDARASGEDGHPRRAHPPADERSRGDTPVGATLLPDDQEIERQLIAADEGAPRLQAATRHAARHPDGNEDRVLCDPARGVAAVFDGIGGEAGGELAARAACGAMAIALDDLPPRDDLEGRRRWLATAVHAGQAALEVSKRLHDDCSGQGTTAVAAVLAGEDRVLTTCVGDSRVYRIRAGRLALIADEHEDVVPRPEMADALDRVRSAEDFEGAPKDLPWAFSYRNIVSVELGSDAVRPTVREHRLTAGDLILVASDGVHDNLAHQEIEAVVAACAGRAPQALATALVARAYQRSQDHEHLRSKDDDVTCAVLKAG